MPNYRRLAQQRAAAPTFGPLPDLHRPSESDHHWTAFLFRFPDLGAWLQKTNTAFSNSLKRRIRGGQLLTPNQIAALERAAAPAPVVDVSRIEAAFASAKERGIKHPKITLDGFRLSLAGERSTVPGAINVKEDEAYLGRVVRGVFLASPMCAPEKKARIIAAIADPHTAAVAWGMRTGTCAVCGRSLQVTESVDLGIGPVCRANYFG